MTHIEQLTKLVKNRLVPKVIALGGSETALIDEAIALMRNSQKEDDPDAMNYHSHVAGETPFLEVLNALQTPPFLAKSRLVLLDSAEKLDAAEVAQVLTYVANPAPFSLFVLIFKKVDKRNKLFQALEEQKLFFNAHINADDVLALLRIEAQHSGLMLDAEVEQFLLLALDNDLLAIKNALKKLSLNFESKQVSLKDAALHIAGSGMRDVFKLARAISEGNVNSALKTLAIVRNHENALKFLGVLTWQFRVLVHIRHCINKGMADWDIRQEVSIYGDRFLWMVKVAKKRTMAFHIGRLTRLLHCDLTLKSQKTSEPFNVIERLIYQSAVGS